MYCLRFVEPAYNNIMFTDSSSEDESDQTSSDDSEIDADSCDDDDLPEESHGPGKSTSKEEKLVSTCNLSRLVSIPSVSGTSESFSHLAWTCKFQKCND